MKTIPPPAKKNKMKLAPRAAKLFLASGLLLMATGAQAQPGQEPTGADFLQRAIERGATIPLLPTAKLAGGAVVVDGDVAEWAAPAAWGRGAALMYQGLWRRETGVGDWMFAPLAGETPVGAPLSRPDAAMMRLALDDEAIYLAARVADEAIVPASENAALETGDAIAVAFDTRSVTSLDDGGVGGTSFNQWGSLRKRGTFGLVVAAPDAASGTPATVRSAHMAMFGAIEDAQVAARRVEGGYQIEARLPLAGFWDTGGTRKLDAARLSQWLGVQFHVFDRDRAAGASGALPPAPSYTWTRDERTSFTDRERGLPWGAVWTPKSDAATPQTAGAALDVQLSPPQLEENRLFWRAAAFFNGAPTEAIRGDALRVEVESQTSPFEASLPLLPQRATLYSPLGKRSVEATQAQWEQGETRIEAYPSLGLFVAQRDVEARALPGGRYLLSAQNGKRIATRAYMVLSWGLREFAPEALGEAPQAAEVKKWLQEAFWVWDARPFLLEGSALDATLIPFFGGASSRNAQLALFMATPQAPALNVAIEVRAAQNTPQGPKPQGEALWQATVPLRATGARFQVPAERLPRGSYVLQATLLTGEDAARQTISQTGFFQVNAPRETVWKSSVADAPALLRSWKVTGNPGRARFPELTGTDALARGIGDLQWFDGRLYTGDGDDRHNRGPSNIHSYAPEGGWRLDLATKEEGVELFRVGQIEGENVLLVPGIDPADELGETKEWGNAYIKRAGAEANPDFGWIKRRTLPKAGWTPDIATWQGRLWAYVLTGDNKTQLQVSDDAGASWQVVQPAAGRELPADKYFDQMIALPSGLLLTGYDAGAGVFVWDGAGWNRRVLDLLPGLESVSAPARLTPFPLPDAPDGVLYAPRFGTAEFPLFYLPSLDAAGAQMVEAFRNSAVRDIVARDGAVYVLTGQLLQPARDEAAPLYQGEVFESRDLKTWTRRAVFNAAALPNALEMGEGRFYVGLNTSVVGDERDAAAGDVLQLEP